MSTQKKNRILLFIALMLLLTLAIFFFLSRVKGKEQSLLLYESFPSRGTIANWIVNMDTGEKWQVGNNNMEAWRWSPSGKHILFYAYVQHDREYTVSGIWVSDATGNDLRQIFDSKDYPGVKVYKFYWLTDKIVLVNLYDSNVKTSYVSMLNVETGSLEAFEEGLVESAAPQGKIWLHGGGDKADTIDYYIMNLKGERVLTSIKYLEAGIYFFSPNGKSWAYFCEREGNPSRFALCLADISVNGTTNERKIITEKIHPDTQNMWWSQDGKYIGFHIYDQSIKEDRFHVIDAATGATVYDWVYPTKTNVHIWSPRNDQFVDSKGILLDLKTGQINHFFEQIHETVPSSIVDWRIIEIP